MGHPQYACPYIIQGLNDLTLMDSLPSIFVLILANIYDKLLSRQDRMENRCPISYPYISSTG